MNFKKLLAFGIGCFITFTTFAQQIQQIVRGTVIDQDSQTPIVGASVIILDSNPLNGALTDENGTYRLSNVPIGRITLKVTFIGYEDRIVPNILIGSAKEVIQNITMVESINNLKEVVVLGNQKGEILNEMAVVSARTFSVEETQRFAGSFDDPARMAQGFAGVTGNAEGNNDIIVRGNSSRGILWRLEGIAIPNPNHFAGEGTTGGPINALNSHMLANSDFFTGAFAPEYGDASSGVFDMKLKNGNNEQREYSASISTLGLDMSAEGPFKKGYNGSYLVNYRYSSLDLLQRSGVLDVGGIPQYQDLSFKIALPTNKKHNFSVFGLGGSSSIYEEVKDDENDAELITSKGKVANKLGVVGVTHIFQLNDNAYIKSAVAGTGTSYEFNEEVQTADKIFHPESIGKITKSSIIATSAFNYKFNARHKIESGVIVTRHNYKMMSDQWNYQQQELQNELNEKGNAGVFQAYASWKYRPTEKMTMISGLHYLRFALNDNYSVEPRVGIHWQFKEGQAFTAGFGIHSKIDGIATYLVKKYDDDGSYTRPNRNLGLGKAAHLVVGYDNQIGEHSHLKIETYYQHLYDVPVENSSTSAFSLLNEFEGYTNRALVNEGKGKNYGLELTLERYLHEGFYYMSSVSLFRSLYRAKDGVERSTAFDNNYVANLIGGKEFNVGNPNKNKVFFVNTKLVLIGGKRYTPIDLAKSIEKGEEVRNEANPFMAKSDDIFRLDLAIGLRRNRAKTTTEFKFDVQNMLNGQVVVNEYYVPASQSISKGRQLGLLPTISYKISF